MPLYAYCCADCRSEEERVAGLDDHTAVCIHCGGVMMRLDVDLFQAYFLLAPQPGWGTPSPPG